MVGLSDLLRKSPDDVRKVTLVAEGAPLAVADPFAEVGFDAGAVAPGEGLDMVDGEATLSEEVLEADFRPARAIDGMRVNLYEEGGGDEEVAARSEHPVNILACAVWPKEVLEDLLSDDEIEAFVQDGLADIVFGILNGGVFLKRHEVTPFLGGNFEGAELLGAHLADALLAVLIHDDAPPLGVHNRLRSHETLGSALTTLRK